jgi:hypothetical protein
MLLNEIFRKTIFITLPIILVILVGNVNAKSLNNVDFATYEITVPDGNTYEIEAPQDATKDQVSGRVISKYQDKSGADRYTTEIVVSGFNGVIQMLDSVNNTATPVKPSATPIELVVAEAWPDDVPF